MEGFGRRIGDPAPLLSLQTLSHFAKSRQRNAKDDGSFTNLFPRKEGDNELSIYVSLILLLGIDV